MLPPFSGLLDVRFERGRVPRIDLSYLSLESIVAPGLNRRRRRRTARSTPETAVHSRAESAGGSADGPELTVRELLVAERRERSEKARDEGADGRGTGPPAEGSRTGAATGDPPAGRYRLAPPSFTTVDRSEPPRPAEVPATTPDGRDDAGEPGAGDDAGVATGSAGGPAFAPKRTVIDRSAASGGSGDRAGGVPPTTAAEASVGPDAGGISPPRMVPDRRAENPTSGSTRAARAVPEPPTGSPAGVRQQSAPDQQVDAGDPLSAVVDASTDPESRLVDRLYRTLRERDAIERRRRGER